MKKSPVGKVAVQAIIIPLNSKLMKPKINFYHTLKGVCEYAFK